MSHALVRRYEGSVVPSDLAESVGKMCQLPEGRTLEAQQSRNYRVDCASGDTIYIQEKTQIRIYDT
jgi:hypothetical protein